MDKDMLAAALLHDVGKAGGRVPFWTRPVIVLGKMCAPRLLSRLVVDPRFASSGGGGAVWGEGACTALGQGGASRGPALDPPPQGGAVLARPANAAGSRLRLRRQAGRKASTPSPQPPHPRPYWSRGCFVRSIIIGWRRALGYAWWHAEIGAEMAAAAGLSERAVLYIRTHHQPDGPAAALHIVDEAS